MAEIEDHSATEPIVRGRDRIVGEDKGAGLHHNLQALSALSE